MPLPLDPSIPSSFPYGRKYKNGVIHKGEDFSDGREGHPVRSIAKGVVTHAGYGGWGAAYGQHIIVRTTFKGQTKWVLEAHLKTETVRVGQTVEVGQVIGTSGGAPGRKYSGNSTGPHLHIQVGYQNRYDRYEDPWPMLNAGASAPPPAATPPKPVEEWDDGMLWNLAASDAVRGKATWDERAPKIVKALEYYSRTIMQLLEVETEGKQGRDFERRLNDIGIKVAVADNQRMIAVTEDCKVGHTKVITLDDRGPAKDDKQIVLAEIWTPRTTNALAIETGHFEFRDGAAYDRTRAAQAKQTKADTLAWASRNDIPTTRVVFGNDENARVGNDSAWGTTFTSLRSRSDVVYGNEKYDTICGWDGEPKKSAKVYDPDKVRVSRQRPMVGGSTSLTYVDDKLSDHCPVIYTLGKN